ncbi:MAG: ChbG/HpnK family deacetylase [Elusimicrobia bacterium]|nr:ChbG/HpnK family deacetylase [Elusimicrobiota bacterium]
MPKTIVIVNADDLGACPGANSGILRAHQEGIVTSASILATTLFYRDALKNTVEQAPGLGIGLHFTLTVGKPVSPARNVPLLINGQGFFRWDFTSLLWALSRQRQPALLEQIGMELNAQLDRLTQDGVRPDHINSERHVHMIPAIFRLVLKAAQARGIAFVRIADDIGRRYIKAGDLPVLLMNGGLIKHVVLGLLTRCDRKFMPASHPVINHLASVLYTGKTSRFMPELLKNPPEGIVEIMVHPGMPAANKGIALDQNAPKTYFNHPDREREMNDCIQAKSKFPLEYKRFSDVA